MAVLLGLCASIYIIIQFLDEENMLHLNLKFHVIAKVRFFPECLYVCVNDDSSEVLLENLRLARLSFQAGVSIDKKRKL